MLVRQRPQQCQTRAIPWFAARSRVSSSPSPFSIVLLRSDPSSQWKDRSVQAEALGPRVPAAAEEAVLVVVGRGFAARFDLALFRDHGLDSGPRRQLLEPALEIRQI